MARPPLTDLHPPAPEAADGIAASDGHGDGATPELPEPTATPPPRVRYGPAIGALLLSTAVLGIIGYFTFDAAAFAQAARNLHPGWLAAALLTVPARVFLGGWRLRFISKGKLSWGEAMRGQLAWDFFSNVTPSAVGGAPVAAFYVTGDSRLRLGEASAVLVFAVLLDQIIFALVIPLVLLASLYIEVFPAKLGDVGTGVFLLLFLGMLSWSLLFAYATLVRPSVLEKVAMTICKIPGLRRFRDRVQEEAQQLRRRAFVLRSQKPSFYLKGGAISLGAWLLRYMTPVFVVGTLYPQLDALLIALRTVAMTLGSLVMPTPGAAGGVEGLYALFIAPLIPEATVAPTLLAWRFLAYYVFIGLGVYVTMHGVQRRLQRQAEEAQAEEVQGDGLDDRERTPEPVLHEEPHV